MLGASEHLPSGAESLSPCGAQVAHVVEAALHPPPLPALDEVGQGSIAHLSLRLIRSACEYFSKLETDSSR